MTKRTAEYEICTKVEAIPGWLHTVTARRTIDILAWQGDVGIEGNLMEIGVYCGRYFSILLDSAQARGNTVLGVDTFQFAPVERVAEEMRKALGEDAASSYELWQGDSSRISAGEILARIGRPRFISIDGAHDFASVYHDMQLAETVLSADGVIAADDFLNPLTLGVNQAINQFLSTPRVVVPVAYIANKLFLAHRSRADEYRRAIEEMIMKADDPESVNFREQIKHGRHHIEQFFHGHAVLIS
jgi:hypothetical protein